MNGWSNDRLSPLPTHQGQYHHRRKSEREKEREKGYKLGGGRSKMVALGILWVNGEINSPVRYIEGLYGNRNFTMYIYI